MAQHTAQWFLENLEGVEGSSGQYSAWCPCHADIGTSVKGLSMTVTASGKILIRCHSCGADIAAVARALEGEDPYQISETDWRPNVHKVSKNGTHEHVEKPLKDDGTDGLEWWAQKTQIPANTWQELGVERFKNGVAFLFEGMEIAKVRKPPKEFAWIGAGERPPLWPLPDDQLPEEIAICEGESDTGTLRHLGFHAFSITAGAGKSREGKRYLGEEHFRALHARGARKVLLCGDLDPSGSEMMATLADVATAAEFEVSVLRLDLVLDPFSGINDLNGMWREAGPKEFGALLQRSIHAISAEVQADTYQQALQEASEVDLDWLIPGLVSPSDKILISGPQKSYKTWVALELVRSMLTGSAFLKRTIEWTPTRTARKVMFVQEEGSRQMWVRRFRKLNMPEDTQLIFWHRKGFRFTDPERVAQLIDICRREGVEALFLDPLQRMIPGIDENDSSATGVVWDGVQRIQEACPGIVVCILHHSNKAERLTWESVRGSSRHAGEVDLGLFLEKHPVEEHTIRIAVDGRDIPQYLGTGESFEVQVRMSSEEEEDRGNFYFEMDGTEIRVSTTTGALVGKHNRDVVLDAVKGGARTIKEVVKETRISRNTVIKHLSDLAGDGSVVEVSNGDGKAKEYVVEVNE